ncbi:MAG: biotin transporter BioY, partial [Candidatus Eisenbacteria bacterium]
LVGALAERGWDRRFGSMLVAMLLGSTVIFALGLAQLARFVPQSQLLAAGLLPFVPGDLVKSVLASLAFPFAWRFAHERGGIGA